MHKQAKAPQRESVTVTTHVPDAIEGSTVVRNHITLRRRKGYFPAINLQVSTADQSDIEGMLEIATEGYAGAFGGSHPVGSEGAGFSGHTPADLLTLADDIKRLHQLGIENGFISADGQSWTVPPKGGRANA